MGCEGRLGGAGRLSFGGRWGDCGGVDVVVNDEDAVAGFADVELGVFGAAGQGVAVGLIGGGRALL